MPSNFALALQCQLKRDEMHELLVFSAEAALVSSLNDTVENGAASDVCDKQSLWRLLLTNAHVRLLMVNTLVRVSIPKSKQQLLIHGNKYVKASGTVEGKPHNYRVGKVVALLPRPRAPSEAPQGNSNAASSASLLSEWLLAINFGEVTELLGAKYVSNESFTVEEHAVYVNSCLSTRADTSSASASASSVGTSTLMTAPEADIVIRNLRDIHRFVAAVVAKREGKAITGITAAAAIEETTAVTNMLGGSLRGGGNRKRPRDAMGDVEDGGDSDDGEADVSREELRRREALCAEQQRHLAGLRQLLNSKTGEVQRALQAQRVAEAGHAAEAEQWRAKAEEQGQAMRRAERLLAEEREAHKEHQEKSGKLVTQLKKLAEQTRKFKEISDTLAEWLRTSTKQPEEVLEALKRKIKESQA